MVASRLRVSLPAFAVIMFCLTPSFQYSARSQEFVHDSLGSFQISRAVNGILIAAPHGLSDKNSAPIAVAVSRLLGGGYLIAKFPRVEKRRINVNRPTEMLNGVDQREVPTQRAEKVYGQYLELARHSSSNQKLRIFVEIHGHASSSIGNTIEIATVGVSLRQAESAKESFLALKKIAQRADSREGGVLSLRIEPSDKVRYSASVAKRMGIFSEQVAPIALHIELPPSARIGLDIKSTAQIVAGIVKSMLES